MIPNDQLKYPFEWLDEIIETQLNPESADYAKTSHNELEAWQQQLSQETISIWKNLKAITFQLLDRQKIITMLGQYQECLEELKRQALVNMAAYPKEGPMNSFCEQVLHELDRLQHQLRRRYTHYLAPGAGNQPAGKAESREHQPIFKVTCRLSVDQIAILLKAADDTRLLTARSFSLVLRSITPYLSTERMPAFSWKSARSSTMKMEERDKQITIGVLEQLIKKIHNY